MQFIIATWKCYKIRNEHDYDDDGDDDGDDNDDDEQGKLGAVSRTSCWTNPDSALLWREKRSGDVRLIALILHCLNCKCC